MRALTTGSRLALKAVTHIGSGDPVLYKRFVDLARGVRGLGLDQAMFTNGDFPKDYCRHILDTFTWIRFSLDAATTETHNRVHVGRGSFPSIIDNIEWLVANRKGRDFFTVGIQFVLHQKNHHELKEAGILAKKLGADYLNIKPVINRGAVGIRTSKFDLGTRRVEEDIRWMRESLNDETFEVVYKPYQFQINNTPYHEDGAPNPDFVRRYKRCYAVNFEWWIENSMDVSVCGPMNKFVGNLREQNIEDILGSERYREVVEAIRIDECYRGCRPHYLNEIMHSLDHPDFAFHKNFVG
ncbi:MAG TPA: radical SAM protein [Rhodospirillaceae bacterium]|jgi:MoaA/NifB/PqqE/SkfB family radical SAM enzyme|nr:radical SAM protein [Rhodospirillales bacterium]HIJ44451.1 radical SAM protein [Rhodospirillaceae bacterium]HIJ45532.1 radical SAM protein [Rhodospirillaceae bacterium]HIJ93895.1 radical SAM protein [Rhodospirillaceae bacterium]